MKVGLAGNLADFTFTGADGSTRTGRQTDYNGAPGGYTAVPADAVTYVDAHDNETLFDALTYKLPTGTAMADRVGCRPGPGHRAARPGDGVRPRRQRAVAQQVAGPQLVRLG